MNEDTPSPSPADPASAGAALGAAAADLGTSAAAANAAAASSLAGTIDALVDSIKAGKARIDAAVAATPRQVEAPVAAAPPPAFTPETLANLCEQKGLPRETADVLVEFAKNVIAPVYVNQITQSAKAAKKDAERDVTPLYDGGPTLGATFKRYGTRINEIIREQGITDAYLAEHGYEKVIRLAAAEDPKFLEERVEVEVKRRTPAPAPGAPTPTAQPVAAGGPPRPPVEGAAPAMPTIIRRDPATRDEQIAAVDVSREEVDRNRAIWGMSEKETKEQKYEIARWEKELGPIGLMQAGGVPVCDIEDVFSHPTNPVREVNR